MISAFGLPLLYAAYEVSEITTVQNILKEETLEQLSVCEQTKWCREWERMQRPSQDYLLSLIKITSKKNDYHCHTLHELILLVSYSPKPSTTKKRYLRWEKSLRVWEIYVRLNLRIYKKSLTQIKRNFPSVLKLWLLCAPQNQADNILLSCLLLSLCFSLQSWIMRQ